MHKGWTLNCEFRYNASFLIYIFPDCIWTLFPKGKEPSPSLFCTCARSPLPHKVTLDRATRSVNYMGCLDEGVTHCLLDSQNLLTLNIGVEKYDNISRTASMYLSNEALEGFMLSEVSTIRHVLSCPWM